MPATHVQFAPVAAVTLTASHMPQVLRLPVPDPAASAVVLHNLGPGEVAVVPGTCTGSVFNAPGAITLHDGQVLLTSHPALIGGDVVTVQTQGGMPMPADEMPQARSGLPAQVIATRGSLTEIWMFTAPATAVI